MWLWIDLVQLVAGLATGWQIVGRRERRKFQQQITIREATDQLIAQQAELTLMRHRLDEARDSSVYPGQVRPAPDSDGGLIYPVEDQRMAIHHLANERWTTVQAWGGETVKILQDPTPEGRIHADATR